MANLFVQTVWIFAHYSIQTIQTLNFIFVSALHMIMSTQHDKNIMIMSHTEYILSQVKLKAY